MCEICKCDNTDKTECVTLKDTGEQFDMKIPAEPKEINVKRIFFAEKGNIPAFELEDGTIKKPYFQGTQQGVKLLWFTDDEAKAFQAPPKKSVMKIITGR